MDPLTPFAYVAWLSLGGLGLAGFVHLVGYFLGPERIFPFIE